jgi:hypothetical protein
MSMGTAGDIMRAAQESHPEIIRGRYAILLCFAHGIDSGS